MNSRLSLACGVMMVAAACMAHQPETGDSEDRRPGGELADILPTPEDVKDVEIRGRSLDEAEEEDALRMCQGAVDMVQDINLDLRIALAEEALAVNGEKKENGVPHIRLVGAQACYKVLGDEEEDPFKIAGCLESVLSYATDKDNIYVDREVFDTWQDCDDVLREEVWVGLLLESWIAKLRGSSM